MSRLTERSVYLLRAKDDSVCKVGISSDPGKRIRQLEREWERLWDLDTSHCSTPLPNADAFYIEQRIKNLNKDFSLLDEDVGRDGYTETFPVEKYDEALQMLQSFTHYQNSTTVEDIQLYALNEVMKRSDDEELILLENGVFSQLPAYTRPWELDSPLFKMYELINDSKTENGVCDLSQADISDFLDQSRRSTLNQIRGLQEGGYLDIVKARGRNYMRVISKADDNRI
jgi:biotin operon repressor